jgi:hypothetical protein
MEHEIGNKVWVVIRTDIGYQVRETTIEAVAESKPGQYGNSYKVTGIDSPYEFWQLHEYQEDAIGEIVDIKLQELSGEDE